MKKILKKINFYFEKIDLKGQISTEDAAVLLEAVREALAEGK